MLNSWKQVDFIGTLVVKDSTSWQKESLRVLFSPREKHTESDLGGGYWKHLSISHPRRYPYWHEIIDARYTFFEDDDTVIQILPPKSEYVNLHPNCFHLWSKIRG